MLSFIIVTFSLLAWIPACLVLCIFSPNASFEVFIWLVFFQGSSGLLRSLFLFIYGNVISVFMVCSISLNYTVASLLFISLHFLLMFGKERIGYEGYCFLSAVGRVSVHHHFISLFICFFPSLVWRWLCGGFGYCFHSLMVTISFLSLYLIFFVLCILHLLLVIILPFSASRWICELLRSFISFLCSHLLTTVMVAGLLPYVDFSSLVFIICSSFLRWWFMGL